MGDVDVRPQLCPPLGEVSRGFQNALGSHRSLVDDVHLGQEPILQGSVRGVGTWVEQLVVVKSLGEGIGLSNRRETISFPHGSQHPVFYLKAGGTMC